MNRTTLSRRLMLFALPALMTSTGTVFHLQAQTKNKIRSVTRYTIQPGRVGDFRAAVKEYNALLAKAGWDQSMTIWAAASGQNEFSLVRNHTTWSELDSPPARDPKLKEVQTDLRLVASRIMQCVVSSERILDELQTDVSMPVPQEMPKMVRVLRTRVKLEKMDEYLALYKSEVMPAAKKGGLNLFLVHRVRFGAPSNQFSSVSDLASWGDLDMPAKVVTGMGGREAYEKFLTRIRPLLESAEYNVYRFEPELSYIPGKNGRKAVTD